MTRKETLERAAKIVCTDREAQYGRPENNFSVIAGLWSVYLGVHIDAHDVAAMMALAEKIARIKSGSGRPTTILIWPGMPLARLN